MIKVSNIVYHKLSNLYFLCENKKQEKWMNENPYYVIRKDVPDMSYFRKMGQ